MARRTVCTHHRKRSKFKGKNAYALSAMDELFDKKQSWYSKELFIAMEGMLHPNHMPKRGRLNYLLKIHYAKGNVQDGTLSHRESADYTAVWIRRE